MWWKKKNSYFNKESTFYIYILFYGVLSRHSSLPLVSVSYLKRMLSCELWMGGKGRGVAKNKKCNLPALGTLETDLLTYPTWDWLTPFFLHWTTESGQLVLDVWGRWVECCLFGLLVLIQTCESEFETLQGRRGLLYEQEGSVGEVHHLKPRWWECVFWAEAKALVSHLCFLFLSLFSKEWWEWKRVSEAKEWKLLGSVI